VLIIVSKRYIYIYSNYIE